MGKKHKHEEHENLERWLVSYADFITLLFATFTALYALASAEKASLQEVAKAISEGFQEQSVLSGINSVIQGMSPPSENPNPIASDKGRGAGVVGKFDSLTYSPGNRKKLEETFEKLMTEVQKINQEIAEAGEHTSQGGSGPQDKTSAGLIDEQGKELPTKGIDISIQERGIKISIDSTLLFEPGSATLKPGALKALKTIGDRVSPLSKTNQVAVEGHTDNQPIATALFPSNWELSTARASAVVRYFVRLGMESKALSAVGFADSRPLDTNLTAEGRRRNRRVDVTILSERISEKTDPQSQAARETIILKAKPVAQSTQLIRSEDSDGPVPVIFKDEPLHIVTPQTTAPVSSPKASADTHSGH
jgi:chemotaxis protein MotB